MRAWDSVPWPQNAASLLPDAILRHTAGPADISGLLQAGNCHMRRWSWASFSQADLATLRRQNLYLLKILFLCLLH